MSEHATATQVSALKHVQGRCSFIQSWWFCLYCDPAGADRADAVAIRQNIPTQHSLEALVLLSVRLG